MRDTTAFAVLIIYDATGVFKIQINFKYNPYMSVLTQDEHI